MPDSRTPARRLRDAGILATFRGLDRVLPPAAAALAYRLWTTPGPTPADSVRDWPAATESGWVATANGRIRTHVHGGGGPTVLLVHGWGGHAGHWREFVPALTAAGYRVAALDHIGHGGSPRRRTNLAEMIESVRAAARRHGPLAGVVGHSVGGAAAYLAVADGVETDALAVIGSPANLEDMVRLFTGMLGLSERSVAALRRRMEDRYGFGWDDARAERVLPALAAVRGLVVHDRRDREVPFAQAEINARHWPGAALVATEGKGHRRILSDRAAVATVVDFLADAAADPVVVPRRARG